MPVPEHLVAEHARLYEWRASMSRHTHDADLDRAERAYDQMVKDAIPEDVKEDIRRAAAGINAWLGWEERDRFTLEARMFAPVEQHIRTLVIMEHERRWR